MGGRTRDRFRQTIFEHGPLTAAALASRLGLTPAGVRRHLGLLAEQGVIEERELATAGAAGRGRPARAYVLSEAGHAGMGSDCLLYTSPSPRDGLLSRMPSSA